MKILVGYDGSKVAKEALELAKKHAMIWEANRQHELTNKRDKDETVKTPELNILRKGYLEISVRIAEAVNQRTGEDDTANDQTQ